jgi:hypothetical protein
MFKNAMALTSVRFHTRADWEDWTLSLSELERTDVLFTYNTMIGRGVPSKKAAEATFLAWTGNPKFQLLSR